MMLAVFIACEAGVCRCAAQLRSMIEEISSVKSPFPCRMRQDHSRLQKKAHEEFGKLMSDPIPLERHSYSELANQFLRLERSG